MASPGQSLSRSRTVTQGIALRGPPLKPILGFLGKHAEQSPAAKERSLESPSLVIGLGFVEFGGELMQMDHGKGRVEVIAQRLHDLPRRLIRHFRRRFAPVAQRHVKPIQGVFRLGKALEGPVQGLAIKGQQHVEADGLAGPVPEQIAYGEEIAQGFRHFLAVHGEIPVVHPVPHERRAAVGGHGGVVR